MKRQRKRDTEGERGRERDGDKVSECLGASEHPEEEV